ncbi:cytochrome c3 family protein [Malonomonas rubra]|uniref:cytochrome c3 family protein n=1 Tax=Malonomonas rubra TaxID=57040 RepID=UPI0026F0B1B8|nr:cytochrome c3 family protein [Malonomonas rubra]
MMFFSRLKIPLFGLVIILFGATAGLAADCYTCHDPAAFQGQVVHEPIAVKNCLACHAPHVSRHEKLLLQREQELCFTCHEKLAAAIAGKKVLHAPLRDGRCSSCHKPHAAEQKYLLQRVGGELCFECHQESRKEYPASHAPFAEGQCSSCHAAHGGDDHRLLKDAGSGLCLDCHEDNSRLRGKHLDRELTTVDCLSCHNPHGGEKPSLLRVVSHAPFSEQNCQVCHAEAQGIDTCLQCHASALASFNYAHNHLGIQGEGNPCVSCHDPHVGDRSGLLPNNVGTACRDCHADTFARQEKSLHKHGNWETCTDCHQLHGSNDVVMLKQGHQVCNVCHDQHKAFIHPIGEDARDPRNQQPMD